MEKIAYFIAVCIVVACFVLNGPNVSLRMRISIVDSSTYQCGFANHIVVRSLNKI